jgi:hypothetical protein
MKQNSAYDGFLQRARILAVLKESNKKENENLENLINDQMRKLVVELDSFPVTLMQWRRYGQGGEV